MLENLPQTPVVLGSTPSLPPIKEEITSLGIANKSNKSKKLKVALIVFALFFLFASVPTAVYLVRQNQEVRKGAESVCDIPGKTGNDGPGGCCGSYIGTDGTTSCDSGGCQPGQEVCDVANGQCASGKSCRATACKGNGSSCSANWECCSGNCPSSSNICSGPEPTQEPIPSRTPACGQACCGPIPAEKGGGTCGDCRSWEQCTKDNSGCPSSKSCCSTRGCVNDSDCCNGKCQGGTCSGAGTLECRADETGVGINNNTTGVITGTVTWFSRWCSGTTCFCGGNPSTLSLTLQPGQSWSQGILGNAPPVNCSWQSDVTFSNCHNTGHGCVAGCGGITPTPTGRPTPTPTGRLTPTPTTTPPAYTIACEFCRIYDSSWARIIDFSAIRVGQTVYFATSGTTTQTQGITKARFRINGGVWQETTNTHEGKFYIQYTVPSATTYTIESMVYNPTLGWY